MTSLDAIARAPKAMLHDHLDGGLRPATIIDLAAEYGYAELPTTDLDALTAWFRRGADRKSLELYLETFAHTTGVMQERDAIRTSAYTRPSAARSSAHSAATLVMASRSCITPVVWAKVSR